jgi:hydroxyquinol 1,2-dioxygenase
MPDFDETTITAAVIDRVRNAPDPRIREISEALVRHLHQFAREVRLTESEWAWGIRFLTEVGQMCSGTRQEYILLSDTLGVSMLVDAINHRLPDNATQTTVLGPFYVAPPAFPNGADIKGNMSGSAMYVSGLVHGADGRPLSAATVDVWHADDEGFYDLQKQSARQLSFAGRARLRTDSRGGFDFWTVRPAAYPIPHDGPVGKMLAAQGRHPFRPEHIHFMISAPEHRKLVTHIFARGDRYLSSDVVFGVKESLVREYERHQGGTAPDGRTMQGEWYSLHHDFQLAREVPSGGD